MPLCAQAATIIRANLEAIQNGQKSRPVAIGTLTDAHLETINQHRLAHNAPPAATPCGSRMRIWRTWAMAGAPRRHRYVTSILTGFLGLKRSIFTAAGVRIHSNHRRIKLKIFVTSIA